MCGIWFVQPKEKNKTLEGLNCPLPPSECIEETETFLAGAPQKAENKPSQNLPPQNLKGKNSFHNG